MDTAATEAPDDTASRGAGPAQNVAQKAKSSKARAKADAGETAPMVSGQSGEGIVSTRDSDAKFSRADGKGAAGAEKESGAGRSDQTDTPEFRRWFGDSKVVDAEGKPLVVYHATTADFDAFDRSAEGIFAYGDNPDAGGIFFDADPRMVDYYVAPTRKGARVIPAYLRLENPAIIPANMALEQQAAVLRQAEQDGHDGAILGGKEYVVFRPEQIKSAIGNNGQFGPVNPDIRFRQGRQIDPIRFNAGSAEQEPKMTLEEVKHAVAEALAGLRDAPPVDVVENFGDLGIDVRPGVVPMGYTSPEGRIVILADAAESAVDVQRTVFHELFHRGSNVRFDSNPKYIESMLRLAADDPIVQREANAWKATPDGQSKWAEFSRRGPMTGARLANYQALAVEEGLATLAESVMTGNVVKRRSVMGRISGFLHKLAKAWGMDPLADWIARASATQTERFIRDTVLQSGGSVNARSTALLFRQAGGDEVKARGGLSPEEAAALVDAQWPVSDKGRVAAVRAQAQALTANWANKPDVVVVQSLADPAVPQRVRDYERGQLSQGAQGQAEGFFYGGKVYLVASQLKTDAAVQRVLMHESLGHYGLQSVFGGALRPMLRQLATMRRADVEAKAAQYALDLGNRRHVEIAAEEVLAEMAEKRPELGFVRQAVAAIRTWLRKNMPGFRSWKVSDDEIVRSYLLPARGFVERGRAHGALGSLLPMASRSVSQQPARDSAGLPIAADQRGLDNFWRWYSGADESSAPTTPGASQDRGFVGRPAAAGSVDDGRGGSPVNAVQRRAQLDTHVAPGDFSGRIAFTGASGPTNAAGAPVRFYHGTRGDVASFDLSHPGRKDSGWLGTGVYLTDSLDDAHY